MKSTLTQLYSQLYCSPEKQVLQRMLHMLVSRGMHEQSIDEFPCQRLAYNKGQE